jgi:hypothetical protein
MGEVAFIRRIARHAPQITVIFLVISVSVTAIAGLRGPGKYSGVVIFDRWGGCLLFSGVYLMYVSEGVKDRLRQYEGQAIEVDASEIFQPANPGDGLIRELKVLGPTKLPTGYSVEGIKLKAQPKAIQGSRMGVELTITNEADRPAIILGSQIGFALLSEKVSGLLSPSDGPSTAVITRTNVLSGSGTHGFGVGDKILSYSYFTPYEASLAERFQLAPHQSRTTQIALNIPPGHYQFFAGCGGGVHESKLVVSNPVSIDLK